jgi:hypothetical protein
MKKKQVYSENGRAICGAKTRKGKPCGHPAGARTDHPGVGRCYLHGGRLEGAPKKNERAVSHGLTTGTLREWFDKEKRAAILAIRKEQKDLDPLSAQTFAENLLMHEQRIQASLMVLESRANALQAEDKFNDKAREQYHRRVNDFERVLTKYLAIHANLIARFPSDADEADSAEMLIVVPDGFKTVNVPANHNLIDVTPKSEEEPNPDES